MISKILNFLFPETMNSVISSAINKGRYAMDNERREENKKIKRFEIEQAAKMGPVIILSNEWENPVIAKVFSINEDRYGMGFDVEVYDYLTGKKGYHSSTMIPFTWQKLKAIDSLSPDDICALFFEGRYLCREIYKKKESPYREKHVVRTGMKDWKIRLEKNNFFKDYPEYNM